MNLHDLLREMVVHHASDLHLQAGSPPMGRVDGRLQPMGIQYLNPDAMIALAQTLLTPEQRQEFAAMNELDLAYTVPELGRFRCNVFRQRGAVGIVIRRVMATAPTFDLLGLPPGVMKQLTQSSQGLVLITGQTGSGKSTTLAAMISHINHNAAYNIITIEDPIEFLHKNDKSLVVQREIGMDTRDFRTALKYALRQDPDVLMIGEMRDKDTVETALAAAQTGHLVLSTLHTQDTVQTVNRIIDFFPLNEHHQVRQQLAQALVGIVSQRLLPRADGQGRVLAAEILLGTALVKDYIKDPEKTPYIKDAMMEDNIRGMQTFDQHLVMLHRRKLISLEEALEAATSPHEVRLMLMRDEF
ncbi:type IV pilus twitching motility protein PilT [Deinococcus hopiensis]|uniref:Twitching motility protein PilT n=1 Tax=Deinococcus hopiensis KR-140 TaxID=695939 RepID=A0A1W1VGJ1_9DEIO|nr:PilT/PilU family type 4a pilus ATPase [Deinococcus hopiensis]SMB92340.1 twitching motility protein PilT [Deinococcus hopiensis KR-140]